MNGRVLRSCAPRSFVTPAKAGIQHLLAFVMAGLVPAIHVFLVTGDCRSSRMREREAVSRAQRSME